MKLNTRSLLPVVIVLFGLLFLGLQFVNDSAVPAGTLVAKFEKKLEGHTGYVTSLAMSADNQKVFSGSSDKTVRVWDAISGKLEKTFEGSSDSIFTIALSPDGQTLASGGAGKTVLLWDISKGTVSRKLEGHSSDINILKFSNDGKLLASGSADKSVRLWNLTTGATVNALDAGSPVLSVAFRPDSGTLAVGTEASDIKLFDLASGKAETLPRTQLQGVTALEYSTDGSRLVSGSRDSTTLIWDASSKSKLSTLATGDTSSILDVHISADKKFVLTSSSSGTTRLWDTSTQKNVITTKDHIGNTYSALLDNRNKILADASEDKTIRLYSLAAK